MPAVWRQPASDRTECGELSWCSASDIVFTPYTGGFSNRSIPIASGAAIKLIENDVATQNKGTESLQGGDDVTMVVQGGKAVSIIARRGTATGNVVGFTAVTPFSMPAVTIANQPSRIIQGPITLVDGKTWTFQIGNFPLADGDEVFARWNPATNRYVQLKLLQKS